MHETRDQERRLLIGALRHLLASFFSPSSKPLARAPALVPQHVSCPRNPHLSRVALAVVTRKPPCWLSRGPLLGTTQAPFLLSPTLPSPFPSSSFFVVNLYQSVFLIVILMVKTPWCKFFEVLAFENLNVEAGNREGQEGGGERARGRRGGKGEGKAKE